MSNCRLILDTRALCHQMLFAGKDVDALLLADGKTINRAEFAFDNLLERYLMPMLADFSPLNIIAVWDGGKKYRQNLFPKYKAKRQASKEQRDPIEVAQLKKLEDYTKSFIANLGAVNVQAKTVEADDVIALLCKSLSNVMKRVYTLDADLLQLVDAETVVSLKDEVFYKDSFYKGVPPHLITVYKSLVGDTSDEYGGVPQVGEKAWQHLVEQFGFDGMEELDAIALNRDTKALEEVYNDLSSDPVIKKIYDNKATWFLMYDLAKLHPEICYGFDGLEKIQPMFYKRLPNREKISGLLQATGAERFLTDLERFFPTETLVTEENFQSVRANFIGEAGSGPVVAFDYETYDALKHAAFIEALPATQKAFGYVDVLSQRLTGASFCYGDNLQHSFYIPCNHVETYNFDKSAIKDLLITMERNNAISVAHNAGFELQVTLQELDYTLRTPHDTMIMASYVDENEEMGLKSLSKRLFNYSQTSYEEVLGGAEDMRSISGEQVLQYGCDDAFVSAHLWHLFNLILQMEKQWEFYSRNDTHTVHLFAQAKREGIRIDFEEMERQRIADEITEVEGMGKLRTSLEENCSEHNPDAGRRLFELERPYLIASMQHDGKSEAQIQEKLLKVESRLCLAAKYEPYTKVRITPDFIPTLANIRTVAKEIGFCDETIEQMKTLSGKAISMFLMAAGEELTTEVKSEFSSLLSKVAGSELKAREGESYVEFVNFCKNVVGEKSGKWVETGDALNLDSPVQMQELLYCKMDLPVRNRSKVQRKSKRDTLGFEGSPSVNAKAIKLAIAEDCGEEGDWRKDALKSLLKVKEAMTRKELFYRPYPLWQHPLDGCIHPSIRNCGTVTRRPTGTSPNILAVSKGNPRNFFLPRYEGHVIVSPDYSGQELRLTASESNDPVLIDAYVGGGTYVDEFGMTRSVVKDIHTVTACSFTLTMMQREFPVDFQQMLKAMSIPVGALMPYDVFRFLLNATEEEVTSKYGFESAAMVQACINSCRYMAKIVNFLIIYGGGPTTLASSLGIRVEFAKQLMEMVFKAYGRLEPWQQEVIRRAYDKGYVTTAYGTWKHVSKDIRSKDNGLRSRAERQAVNQTIQGAAADILKIALTTAHTDGIFADTGAIMLAPVYDEITCSVPIKNLYEFCQRMRTAMNVTPPGHAVPMMAEFAIGPTWGTQTELGDNPSRQMLENTITAYNLEKFL